MKRTFLAIIGSTIFPAVLALTQQPSVSNRSEFQWTESAGGLQFGVLLDKTNGLLRCRIRNATTNTLTVTLSCEDCQLELQQGTNWTKLPALSFPICVASGIGPQPEKIAAGQIIARTIREWPIGSFADYLRTARGNTNEARLLERLNRWLAARVATCRGDTFAFDLIEADWPTNAFRQPLIRIRAGQKFGLINGLDHTTKTLRSAEIALNDYLIQSFKHQRDHIYGKN